MHKAFFSRLSALLLALLVSALPATAGVPGGDDVPNRLYVCNQGSATISVIDMASMEIVHTVDLKTLGYDKNAKPHHVAVEPDGSSFYVSLIGASKVLKFNSSYELIGEAEFETPGMLAIHPNNDLMYVGRSMMAVNPPQRIGVIERACMAIDEIDVFFPRPHAIMVNPRGDVAYTASLAVNQYLTLNLETEEIDLGTLDGDIHTFVQFAVSPDGNTMVVGGQISGQLLVFDTSEPGTAKLIDSIEVNAAPWHPVFTPDGNYVYFGNKGANTVTVVDMEARAVKTVIEGDGISEPHGSAVSTDGKYVFISNNNLKGGYMGPTRRAHCCRCSSTI